MKCRQLARLCALALSSQLLAASPAMAGKRPLQLVAQTPPLTIVHVETNDVFNDITTPGGTVLFARTAPAFAGAPDGWWLRMDVGLRNDGAAPLTVTAVALDTDETLPDLVPLAEPLVIQPGATELFVPQEAEGTGAMPNLLGIRVHTAEYAQPVQRVDNLAEFRANTPSGGFRFPGRAEDLPPNHFWRSAGDHSHNRSQRYAYDYSVWRLREDGTWTKFRQSAYDEFDADPSIAVGDRNEHYLVFGMPIYAIGDGTIVKCKRSEPDLDPEYGTDDPANVMVIELDSGEVVGMGHFKENSIPPELCPQEWPLNTPVRVVAGQRLGEAGGSGTEGPHLHIQIQDGSVDDDGDDIRGLPLQWYDIDVQDVYSYDPDHWTRVSASQPVASRGEHIIRPNPCGWTNYDGLSEVAHNNISASCYQSVSEAVAEAGFRQTFVDGYTVNGQLFFNAVWTPRAGIAWASRHNLSGAQLDAEIASRAAAGYALTHVDSYIVGGVTFYAALFAKVPGVFESYHGLTYAAHKAAMDALAAENFQPLVVSVVSDDGERRYTALYQLDVGGSWEMRSQVAGQDYQALVEKQADAGRGLRSLRAYWHGGELYYAAIFASRDSAPVYLHGLSWGAFRDAYFAQRDAGLFTRLIAGYEFGGAAFFAAAWQP